MGAAMADRGAFEVDTSSGSVEWVNDFALSIMGCSPEQVTSMSIFDMSPERFHDQIREDVAEVASGKSRRFFIFPTRTADGKVAWWYAFKVRNVDSRRWSYAEHIHVTPQSGPEFSFMSMQMDLVNNQTTNEARVDELDQWAKEHFRQVDGKIGAVRTKLDEVGQSLEKAENAAMAATAAATDAKNAALATQTELKRYATKEDIQHHFEKFDVFEEENTRATTEILRLIRTDTVQEERLRAYEDYVKKTTESAVRAIEAQASKSGRGLSRKVTVPIFVVTTMAMVIQFVLQHWNVLQRLGVR